MTLLDQSLCLLDGISPEAEIRLRRKGVLSCRQLASEAELHLSPAHAARVRASFAEMDKAESLGLADWFVNHLPAGHRVRALMQFMPDASFYDIETDGMSQSSQITCISVLRAGRLETFVQGRNLEGFLEAWACSKILAGFNSKRFDTPAVCRRFGLTRIPAQVDLMDEARHYGCRGGLKSIEKTAGFSRTARQCLDGRNAIHLWCEYKHSGSEEALNALVEYNRDDVRSLLHLAKHLARLSLDNTGIRFYWPDALGSLK